MEKFISINQEKVAQVLAQKIAEYWNGKEIPVSGGVGSTWRDWKATGWDEQGNWTGRAGVPGTVDKVSAITGTIHATANGETVTINIDYQVQIQNIG